MRNFLRFVMSLKVLKIKQGFPLVVLFPFVNISRQ